MNVLKIDENKKTAGKYYFWLLIIIGLLMGAVFIYKIIHPSVQYLVEQLNNGTYEEKQKALNALMVCGDRKAIQPILEMIKQNNPYHLGKGLDENGYSPEDALLGLISSCKNTPEFQR